MESLVQELVSPPATPSPLPSPRHPVADDAKPGDIKSLGAAGDDKTALPSADPATHSKEPEIASSVPAAQPMTTPDAKKDLVLASREENIGKKLLLRAMKVLEWKVEDYFEEAPSGPGVPSKIAEQLKTLQDIGQRFKSETELTEGPDDSDDSSDSDDETVYECEIKRLNADDWPKAYQNQEEPYSVILAFNRNESATVKGNEHLSRAQSKIQKEHLYRVVINNYALYQELCAVTNINLYNFPTCIAPPFKVLVPYHAKMADRLVQLRKDLDKVQKEIAEDESNSQPRAPDVAVVDGKSGMSSSSPSTCTHENGPSEGGEQPPSTHKPPTGDIPERSQNSSPTPQENNGAQKKDKPAEASASEDEAQSRKNKAEDLTTRISYLQLLHDFIKSDLASYLEVQANIDSGSVETIAFEHLWYLFRPGVILYAKEDGHDCLYQCYSVTGGQSRKRNLTPDERARRSTQLERENQEDWMWKPTIARQNLSAGTGAMTPFVIDCFYMGFDGVSLGPVDTSKQINHYNGEVNISELDIYPLHFHKNKDEIQAKLRARGRRITTTYGHMSYNGMNIPAMASEYQEDIDGDIFIDLKSYYQAFPRNRPRLGYLRSTDIDLTEDEESQQHETHNNRGIVVLTDREVDYHRRQTFKRSHAFILDPTALGFVKESAIHLQLLSYRLPAYVFRSRKYVHIDIELAHEINKSVEARGSGFEDLVIPDAHRKLLIALVQDHLLSRKAELERGSQHKTQTQIDIVRGKGRGLIILLHGPPGSGKTSTAETLAAYTQRPLYSITCGDLGTNPTDVERNLVIHTTRAHKWDCLLLLDEADVFVSRRDWRDTERNALVSVFLRQLEYYSGILFLTTNRIGVMDEAFKSRIHVSLRYPSIGLAETLKIWDNILDRIERDNKQGAEVPIRFDRDALLKYAENHYRRNEPDRTWNGRQIRNAFQLAIALGRHERERLLTVSDHNKTTNTNGKKAPSVKLTVASFRSIAETAREFEEYLVDLRGGHTDSRIAFEESLRYDAHGYAAVHTTTKDYGAPKGARRGGDGFQRESSASLLSPSHNGIRGTHRRGSVSGSPSGPRKSGPQVSPSIEEYEEVKEEEDDIFEEDLSDD